jgi:hypothetical protein
MRKRVTHGNHVLFGMIVLLSASLLFLGCPTESDSDTVAGLYVPDNSDNGPTIPNSGQAAAQALADTLTDLGLTVTPPDANGNITITSGGSVTVPISVPANTSLTVDPRVTLTTTAPITVAAGSSLNVDGNLSTSAAITVGAGSSLNVEGDLSTTEAITVASGAGLNVTGSLSSTDETNIASGASLNIAGNYESSGVVNNAGTIEVEGVYTLDNVTGTNTGNVTVKDGGIIYSVASISGTGINTVEQGGKVYFNDGTGDPFVGSMSDATALFQLDTGGKLSYNNASYIVEGPVTLNDLDGGTSTPEIWLNVDAQTLTIKKDGTLTLVANAVLGLGGSVSPDTAPVVGDLTGAGDHPPMIIFSSGSSGEFSYSSTHKYFYPNSSNTGNAPIAGKTYEWKDDVNGAGPGWEATS